VRLVDIARSGALAGDADLDGSYQAVHEKLGALMATGVLVGVKPSSLPPNITGSVDALWPANHSKVSYARYANGSASRARKGHPNTGVKYPE
jgi:hypothetical protein